MINYIKIYDLIGFKICWIACAFSTKWGMPYLGPILTFIFILLHLIIVQFNNRDIKVVSLALLIGLVVDSLFFQSELIIYQGGFLAQLKLAPLWILSMWAGFSVTLLYSLDSIKKRYFISGILGVIGGPLSYNAGVQIGSIVLNGLSAYIALAIVWGLIIPILFYFINRIEANA